MLLVIVQRVRGLPHPAARTASLGNTEMHRHMPLFIDLRLRNCFRLDCQWLPLTVILFILCFLSRMHKSESPQLVCFVIDHIILLRVGRRSLCGSLLFMCAVYCELPLVHSHKNKHFIWQYMFLFCFLQGLGLVITGTMPVFNLTTDGDSKVSREKIPVNKQLVFCFLYPRRMKQMMHYGVFALLV